MTPQDSSPPQSDFVHDVQQEHHIPASSPPHIYPQTSSSPQHAPPKSQSDSEEPAKSKRGRPKKKLNPSAQRGLIRLFVDASKTSIEKLAKAFGLIGGYKRLGLRNFYRETTGAGPKAEYTLDLRDIRCSENTSRTHVDTDEDDEVQDVDDWKTDILSPSGIVGRQNVADDSASLPYSSPAELQPAWKAPRVYYDQEKTTHSACQPVEAPLATTDLPSGLPGPIYTSDKPSLGGMTSSEQARDRTNLSVGDNAAVAHPSTAIKFSDSVDNTQKPKNKKDASRSPDDAAANARINRKDKPKRRGTSLSLTNMVLWLDRGKEGRHYRIAKKNTISNPTPGYCEYDVYFRGPLFVNVEGPTLHESVSSLGALHPPSHSNAVAVRILTDTSAEQGQNPKLEKQDAAARDQLKYALMVSQSDPEVFVNTRDDLGMSPLHLSVAYGYTLVCQWLLQYGANIKAVTNNGVSIYDFAEDASRRVGDHHHDMRLYYRILNCRRHICAGEPPPAPRKRTYPLSKPLRKFKNLKAKIGKRKREQSAEMPSSTPGNMETSAFGPDFDSGGSYPQTDIWGIPNIPNQSGERRPSYATGLTESPPPSTMYDERSVQSNMATESPEHIFGPTTHEISPNLFSGYLPIFEPGSQAPSSAHQFAAPGIAGPLLGPIPPNVAALGGYSDPQGQQYGGSHRDQPLAAPYQPHYTKHQGYQQPLAPHMRPDLLHGVGSSVENPYTVGPSYGSTPFSRSAPNIPAITADSVFENGHRPPTFLELTPQRAMLRDPGLFLQPHLSVPIAPAHSRSMLELAAGSFNHAAGTSAFHPVTTQSGPENTPLVSAPGQGSQDTHQGGTTEDDWNCFFQDPWCQRYAQCNFCKQNRITQFPP